MVVHHASGGVLAIIPVRECDVLTEDGLVTLRGRPLLDYTVQSARQAACLTRIIVSTDGPEVAEYVQQLGAETPFVRPKELAAPEVPLLRVVQHCLTWLEQEEDYQPEIVVLMEVSHPIRPEGLIDRVVESLLQQELDSVFTVFECRHVFWRMSDTGDLTRVEFKEGSTRARRRPLYGQLRGLVCATRVDTIRSGTLIGHRVGIVPVRGLMGLVDVQEEEGLELAEFVLEQRLKDRS